MDKKNRVKKGDVWLTLRQNTERGPYHLENGSGQEERRNDQPAKQGT